MRTFYSSLMRLYPAQYRRLFAEEMLASLHRFAEPRMTRRTSYRRSAFFIREMAGLLIGVTKASI